MASTVSCLGRRTHLLTPKKPKTKPSSSNDFEIWDDSNEQPEAAVRTPQIKSTRQNVASGTPSKTPSGRKTKALGESNTGHTPQKVAELLYKKMLDVDSVQVVSEANDENAPREKGTVSKSVRTGGTGPKSLVCRRVREAANQDAKGNATEEPSETVVRTSVHQIDDEEDEELLRMYANENLPPALPLPGVDPANDTAFGSFEEDKGEGSGSQSPSERVSGLNVHGDQIDHQLSQTVPTRDALVASSTTSSNRTTPIGAFTSPIPFEEFEAVTRKIVDATYEVRRGPLGELSPEHLIKDNWRVSIPSTSMISLSPSPTEAAGYTGAVRSSPISRGMFKQKGDRATPPPKILDGKSAIEHRLNHPLVKPSASPESDFDIFEDKLEAKRANRNLIKCEGNLGARILGVSDNNGGMEEIKNLSILHYGDGFGDPGMNIIYMRQIPMDSPPPPYNSSPPTPRSKPLEPAMAHAAKLKFSTGSESDTVAEQKHSGSPNHQREVFEYKPSKLRIISTSPTSSTGNEPNSTDSPCSSPSLSRNVQTQTSENIPEPNKILGARKKSNPKARKVPSQIRRTPPNRLNARSQSLCVSKSGNSFHHHPVVENHGSATRPSVHHPGGRTPVKFVRSNSFNSFRDPADPIFCSPPPAMSFVNSKDANADENDQVPETSPSARPRRFYRRSRGGTPTDFSDTQSHVIGTLMMESMRI